MTHYVGGPFWQTIVAEYERQTRGSIINDLMTGWASILFSLGVDFSESDVIRSKCPGDIRAQTIELIRICANHQITITRFIDTLNLLNYRRLGSELKQIYHMLISEVDTHIKQPPLFSSTSSLIAPALVISKSPPSPNPVFPLSKYIINELFYAAKHKKHECSLTLTAFSELDKVAIASCGHLFDAEAMAPDSKTGQMIRLLDISTCPLCRETIIWKVFVPC